MSPSFLADITAIAHITTVVAVVIGLLLCFRYKRFRPLEAGALIVIFILWSYYGNCPLTILEQHFRDLADQQANLTSVGFLPYYMDKLFNVSLTSRTIQRMTFFSGGALFFASIEWFAPFMHMEVFKLRKFLKKSGSKKHHRHGGTGLTKAKRV